MKKTILIVDDDSTNLYMLETLLKGYGFEVISAENGKDALDKAILNPPDLIVTDILMPVMDGYALCRRWKSDDTLKHIPLVFYTATYTGSKNEDFALSLGAERFIIKPQEPDILMSILKEVLEENYVVKQVATKPLEEEMEVFRQYNEILFSKLEKKMLDLEIANQELRILEESYRLSFENVSDVIYTLDTDLNIISISPSVEKILGYKPQDFIGRPVSDLGNVLTPESFEQALADMSLILKGDTIHATIYRFIAKDGTIKYGEVSGSPVMREGKIIGIISVARDITDREQAEEELRNSEERFKRLYQDSPTPTFTWKKKGDDFTLLDFNKAAKQLTNGKVFDYLGASAVELYKDRPQILRDLNLCFQEQRAIKREISSRRFAPGRFLFVQYGFIFPDLIIVQAEDQTTRKQAEEALQESEKKYRDLYDFLPIPVYDMDLEANITSVNRAIYETFIGTEEDLKKGFKAWQLISPEDIDKSSKNIQGLLKGEQIRGTEYTLMRLDGSVFPAIVISSVIYSDSKPVGLRGAIVDITERKQREEEMRRMNVFLDSIIENIPDMIFLKDAKELRFSRFNRAGEELLGYSRDDLLGKNDYDFFSKEQADFFTENDRDVLYGKKVVDIPEEPIQTRKKGERILHTKKVPIPDENGEPEYLLGISADITDLKRAEYEIRALLESVQEEKTRLSSLISSMTDEVWFADTHKTFTIANPSALKHFCIDPNQMIEVEKLAKSLVVLRPDGSERPVKEAPPLRALTGEVVTNQEEIIKIPASGEFRYRQVNAAPVRDITGNIIGSVSVVRDITEKKQAEEELQRTVKNLRRAVQTTIQVMVSTVETRDPYTAGHQIRSADLARAIATEMELPPDKIEGIRMAGSIHDIGKLSIPAEILSKPTKLSEIEFRLIKEHSRKGYEILKDVESPWPLAEIVFQHHERMDGSGYPRNLKGDDILMEARILAVSDVVESMASHRPYRPALGLNAALEEIENNKGTIYDADVADACLRLFREKSFQLERA
ncbi:MAG: PAS domain S-box protein [Deltaproteobacteria bacterium]|nr:PAS domain S-box protein [Deltaproteobacteria bacterium]